MNMPKEILETLPVFNLKNIHFPININEIMKVEDKFGISINLFK